MDLQDTPLRAEEVLDVLHAIERREVTFPPEDITDDAVGYSGVPVFHASNGWVFGVFNDCGEWDYLQFVEAPGRPRLEFEDMPEVLQAYQPPVETAYAIWNLSP